MITARKLRKVYGNKVAVDNISFDVFPGHVTGFLGPNGAGKSTTMRLMLGLDSGEGQTLFDGRTFGELHHPMRTVGAVLDARSFHPHRSARDHLRMLAAANSIDQSRVSKVLHQVGLSSVANKNPGEFSLGMGQRLGLAGAILGDPKHLILDEPGNGLDPQGIHWLRDFLKEYAATGKSVFVSSHLLSEMNLMADSLVVIGRGKTLHTGDVQSFIDKYSETSLQIRSSRLAELVPLLEARGAHIAVQEDGSAVVSNSDPAMVGELAAAEGIVLHELSVQSASLEDAFLQATTGVAEYTAGGAAAATPEPAKPNYGTVVDPSALHPDGAPFEASVMQADPQTVAEPGPQPQPTADAQTTAHHTAPTAKAPPPRIAGRVSVQAANQTVDDPSTVQLGATTSAGILGPHHAGVLRDALQASVEPRQRGEPEPETAVVEGLWQTPVTRRSLGFISTSPGEDITDQDKVESPLYADVTHAVQHDDPEWLTDSSMTDLSEQGLPTTRVAAVTDAPEIAEPVMPRGLQPITSSTATTDGDGDAPVVDGEIVDPVPDVPFGHLAAGRKTGRHKITTDPDPAVSQPVEDSQTDGVWLQWEAQPNPDADLHGAHQQPVNPASGTYRPAPARASDYATPTSSSTTSHATQRPGRSAATPPAAADHADPIGHQDWQLDAPVTPRERPRRQRPERPQPAEPQQANPSAGGQPVDPLSADSVPAAEPQVAARRSRSATQPAGRAARRARSHAASATAAPETPAPAPAAAPTAAPAASSTPGTVIGGTPASGETMQHSPRRMARRQAAQQGGQHASAPASEVRSGEYDHLFEPGKAAAPPAPPATPDPTTGVPSRRARRQQLRRASRDRHTGETFDQ